MLPERPDAQTEIFEDVTSDGQRILLNVPTTGRGSIGFQAIINWPALLQVNGR
jgi:alpha-L-fucosidase